MCEIFIIMKHALKKGRTENEINVDVNAYQKDSAACS
jgi:hypothetical protein